MMETDTQLNEVDAMEINVSVFVICMVLAIVSLISDVADDYIHISATLNTLSADDSTALKK